MKRSDLRVGEELYYASVHDWTNDYPGSKVRVVSTDQYRDKGSLFEAEDRYVPCSTGQGVLVEFVGGHGVVTPHRRVVLLSLLRGPWLTTVAAHAERVASNRRWRERLRNERAMERQKLEALAARAAAGRYPVVLLEYQNVIQIDALTLTRLLDAAGVTKEVKRGNAG